MTSLLQRFVTSTDYESYEDFKENFDIIIPEGFNFAYDVVDEYARIDPQKMALIWCNDEGEERFFTYSDLKRYSDMTASFLTGQGIKKGDYVMLTLKSRYEFWFCILALHKIGAVAVPATHMLTPQDIAYRIEKAGLRMIITIAEDGVPEYVDEAVAATGADVTKVMVGGSREGWLDFRAGMRQSSESFERPEGDEATKESDIMLVYFSSGTTGFPKMVQHDHTYPLGHIITASYWQNVSDGGLHYTVADSGWGKCVWGKLYGQWIAGSAVFVYDYERFDAKNMLAMASKYGVTTFCAPPTVYRFLIKEDLSQYDFGTLTYAVTAGEPLNATVYERFYEETGLKLMEGFGQTETVLCIGTFPWMEPKPGSMGVPAPLYDIRIINRDGTPCEIGEEGEIVICTAERVPPGLFVDYHDVERTQEAWHDGFYHTGDMAWMDEDGYLWFVGRADDIIKTSGYKVGPFEVESALLQHPAVLECAITGVPDEIRGQVIKATVVLAKGYSADDELKTELQEHVKRVTAPYKYPRIVEFVTELPKTISGKIRRVEIREHDGGA
jgi:acetyl-CoA synthetase